MSREQSRVDARRDFDDKTRLRLVEGDLDSFDNELHVTNERLSKILWALVGLLISVTTACILIAINVGVGAR